MRVWKTFFPKFLLTKQAQAFAVAQIPAENLPLVLLHWVNHSTSATWKFSGMSREGLKHIPISIYVF
jgi:hypothetical protein